MQTLNVDIREVREIRLKTLVYFGCGAINRITDITTALKERGVKAVLVVTGGRSYKLTGAWDKVSAALDAAGIKFALFDKVTPNPTTVQIDAAAEAGRAIGAQAVIAIGGGSPIDAGKSAAIVLANPGRTAREIYEYKFVPTQALPLVAINLTHGTGTEVDRFAVATIPEMEYKPAIAYDCIYPEWAIDDPELMTGLSEKQTRFVSIDAINHSVEAATTTCTNPLAITLAAQCIRIVARHLPAALENPKDLNARYHLLYASMLAGVAFDNGMLHYTHALEHPLSAVKPDLTHGLGLSILLPAVVKRIYPVRAEILADILAPLAPGLRGNPAEAEAAAIEVENWLKSVGAPEKLADVGFTEADIDRLVELVMTTPSLESLLSLAPDHADRDAVREIYLNSLHPFRR